MKKFVMRAVLVLAGGVFLVALPSSGQAQFDPFPQQIVTLASSGNLHCGPSGVVVDSMIDPADGSLEPFVIPQRRVLVLTGGTWSASGLPSGAATTLQVFLNPPSNPPFPLPIVMGPSVVASGPGVDAYAAGPSRFDPVS